MPRIDCIFDSKLPPNTFECGSELHEAILCDLRVRREKTGGLNAALSAFSGIGFSEKLTLGAWELHASPDLFVRFQKNGVSSWNFFVPHDERAAHLVAILEEQKHDDWIKNFDRNMAKLTASLAPDHGRGA